MGDKWEIGELIYEEGKMYTENWGLWIQGITGEIQDRGIGDVQGI